MRENKIEKLNVSLLRLKKILFLNECKFDLLYVYIHKFLFPLINIRKDDNRKVATLISMPNITNVSNELTELLTETVSYKLV